MTTPKDEEERRRLLEAEAEIFGKTMGFSTTPTPEQMERTIQMRVKPEPAAPPPDGKEARSGVPPRPKQAAATPTDTTQRTQDEEALSALDNLDDLDALFDTPEDTSEGKTEAGALDTGEPDLDATFEQTLAGLDAPAEGPTAPAKATAPKQEEDALDLDIEDIVLDAGQLEAEAAESPRDDEHERTISTEAYEFALNTPPPTPMGAGREKSAPPKPEGKPPEPASEPVEQAPPVAEKKPATVAEGTREADAGRKASPPPPPPPPPAPEAPAAEPEVFLPPTSPAERPKGHAGALLALLALLVAGGAGWLAFQERQRADRLEARLQQMERTALRQAETTSTAASVSTIENRLNDLQRQLDDLTRVISSRLMPPPKGTDEPPASGGPAPRTATPPAPTAARAAATTATSKPTPASSGQGAGDWIVNISSTTSEAAAQRELKRMRALGVQAEAVPVEIRGRTWYRIRISGLPDKAAASARAREVAEKLGIGDIWISRARD
ncbi:MAG: SPOR domain-containing protein [Mariprofundaceae bacterium]